MTASPPWPSGWSGTGDRDAGACRRVRRRRLVGRASGRAIDLRRTPGYPPYEHADICRAGAAGGRRRCAGAHPLRRNRRERAAAAGPAGRACRRAGCRCRCRWPPARASAGRKGSAAISGTGCGWTAGRSPPCSCATRAGCNGRCWRPPSHDNIVGDFPLCHQIVQLLLFRGGFVMVWRRLLATLAARPGNGAGDAAGRGGDPPDGRTAGRGGAAPAGAQPGHPACWTPAAAMAASWICRC